MCIYLRVRLTLASRDQPLIIQPHVDFDFNFQLHLFSTTATHHFHHCQSVPGSSIVFDSLVLVGSVE